MAAIRAAQLGGRVTLVEKSRLGGTCLNAGCIPTKALAKTAELFAKAKSLRDYGIIVSQVGLDFRQVMAQKDAVVRTLVAGVESLIRANRIHLISGEGTVLGPGRVSVRLSDGSEAAFKPEKLILATGSMASHIPGVAIDGLSVITSTAALSLQTLPESMLLIGGGVIGVELAGIFGRLGTRVTVVEAMPSILPGEDAELASLVRQRLERIGVRVHSGAKVKAVTKAETGVQVAFEASGAERSETVQKVVVCVGRRPNTAGLDLGKLGLGKPGDRGIKVNHRMETAVLGIYAAGDVTGGYQLAHVASEEGVVAAENALGRRAHMSYRSVPRCIFSVPEVGAVGLTEDAARKEYGEDVLVGRFPMAANGKALANGDKDGLVKIMALRSTGEILGVGIAGTGAADLVAEASLAISAELTVDELIATIHAHPTIAETVKEAALAAAGRPLHIAG